MTDDLKLVDALGKIASEYWRPDSPIFLSNVPRILVKTLPEFRAILGQRPLKEFAKANETGGSYQIVEHPTQRSKVVLAPADKAFLFPAEDSTSASTAHSSEVYATKSRAATLGFLACLVQLSDEEKSQVIIPTAILVKLLQK